MDGLKWFELNAWAGVPAVGFTHGEHRREDGVPSVGVFEGFVREHATVPADVLDTACLCIFEPVSGALDDIEFSVWIIGAAVFAGLIVGACTVDMPIVLGDVEIDGPGSELVGHAFVGLIELLLGVVIPEHGMFGGVVTEQVEIGVGQVGLESEGFGHTDSFEDIEHISPGVHTGPADFAFGGESLSVVFGDIGGFLERIDDAGGVGFGIGSPFFDTELGAIDADHTVFADAVVLKDSGDSASHFNGREEFLLALVITHGRVADGPWPNRSDQRADGETVAGDLVGDLSDFRIARIGVGMGEEQEVIDSVELLAIDIRSGGQFEHALERDWRFLIGAIPFTDKAWPHGVVEFRKLVHRGFLAIQINLRFNGRGLWRARALALWVEFARRAA